MITTNKRVDLLLYYQCILAVGAVCVFFSELDVFLYDIGKAPRPLILIILFCLASIPLAFSFYTRDKYFPIPVVAWCAGYICISLFSFLLFYSSEVAFQELETRILSVIFLMTMLLVFSKYSFVQLWTRRAILGITVVSVLNIIYELFNPLVFGGLNITGRPAGFYVDANESSCGMILGMIFSIGLLPPKYRVYLMSLVGFGVLLTFSRGGILSWFIVTLMLIKMRVIPGRQLIYWILGLGVALLVAGAVGGNVINLDKLQTYGIRERLEWFENPSLSENSADARLIVAKIGWQLFAENPFLGNGIGSTLELPIGISTHNMYLYFMADHGILGAFILPALVYVVTRHTRGEYKYIALPFAAFILVWGLFSHTILQDRFVLIIFALMSVLSVKSQEQLIRHGG